MFPLRVSLQRLVHRGLLLPKVPVRTLFTKTTRLCNEVSSKVNVKDTPQSTEVIQHYATKPGFVRNAIHFYLNPKKWGGYRSTWFFGYGALFLISSLFLYRIYKKAQIPSSPVVAAGLALVQSAPFYGDLVPAGESVQLELSKWWGDVPSCSGRDRLRNSGSRTVFVEYSNAGKYCFTLELSAESLAGTHYDKDGNFYPYGVPKGMVTLAKGDVHTKVPCVHITRAVVTSPKGAYTISFGDAKHDARAHAQAQSPSVPTSLRYLSAEHGIIEVPVVSKVEEADLNVQMKRNKFQQWINSVIIMLGMPGYSDMPMMSNISHALDVMPFSPGIAEKTVAVSSLQSYPLLATAEATEEKFYMSSGGYFVSLKNAPTLTLQSAYATFMGDKKEPATLFKRDEQLHFFESEEARQCPLLARDPDTEEALIWRHMASSCDPEKSHFITPVDTMADSRYSAASMPLGQWYATKQGTIPVSMADLGSVPYGSMLDMMVNSLRANIAVPIPDMMFDQSNVIWNHEIVGVTTESETEMQQLLPTEKVTPFTVYPSPGDKPPLLQNNLFLATVTLGILVSFFAAGTYLPVQSLRRVCSIHPLVTRFIGTSPPMKPIIHRSNWRQGIIDLTLPYENDIQIRLQLHRDMKKQQWNIVQSQLLIRNHSLPITFSEKKIRFFTSEPVTIMNKQN